MRKNWLRFAVTLAGLGVVLALVAACSSGAQAPSKPAAQQAAPTAAAPASAAQPAATAAPASQPAPASGAAKVLKIGSSQSTSGPNASFAQQALDGLVYGVKVVNAQGGVKIGGQTYTLDLINYDDGSQAPNAVSNVQKLVDQDKVKVVFGPASSTSAQPAQKVTEAAKVINYLSVASVESLTDGTAKYTFRNTPTVSISEKAEVQFMNSQGIKSIASIARQDDSAQTGAKGAKEEMQKYGMKLVGDESIPIGTTDFYSILTKVKAQNPGALLANMGRVEGIPFTKQARELGLNVPIFGWVDWVSKEFVNGVGDALGNNVYSYSTASTSPSDKLKAYNADFKKVMGKDPAVWDSNTYDGLMMVLEAMKTAGTVDDTDKIANALRKLDYTGVLGRYTYTPGGQARMQINIDLIQKGPVVGVPKMEIPGDKLPY